MESRLSRSSERRSTHEDSLLRRDQKRRRAEKADKNAEESNTERMTLEYRQEHLNNLRSQTEMESTSEGGRFSSSNHIRRTREAFDKTHGVNTTNRYVLVKQSTKHINTVIEQISEQYGGQHKMQKPYKDTDMAQDVKKVDALNKLSEKLSILHLYGENSTAKKLLESIHNITSTNINVEEADRVYDETVTFESSIFQAKAHDWHLKGFSK